MIVPLSLLIRVVSIMAAACSVGSIGSGANVDFRVEDDEIEVLVLILKVADVSVEEVPCN